MRFGSRIHLAKLTYLAKPNECHTWGTNTHLSVSLTLLQKCYPPSAWMTACLRWRPSLIVDFVFHPVGPGLCCLLSGEIKHSFLSSLRCSSGHAWTKQNNMCSIVSYTVHVQYFTTGGRRRFHARHWAQSVCWRRWWPQRQHLYTILD